MTEYGVATLTVLKQLLPGLGPFDLGYILGKGESMRDSKKQETDTAPQHQASGQ